MLNTKKRDNKRKDVGLEAVVLAGSMRYPAFIENISENGMFLRIAYFNEMIEFIPGEVLKLEITMPSGKILYLRCREIWSHINAPSSMMKVSGVEIIDPPAWYMDFVNSFI